MELLIEKVDKSHLIDRLALPGLVEFAERQEFESQAVTDYLTRQFERFDFAQYSALVLGCTHYVYIEAQIAAYYGCPVYHGNGGIARRLYTLLRGNRDGRPPDVFELKNLGFSTTIFPQNPLGKEADKKANKRLYQTPLNPLKNQGKGEVVFLGESAENNEKIYKQTYVCEDL